MSLHERIKERRTACGMSQETVAELVGVSRQAVTKWESGQSAPSTENLFRLAEIFGTTVDIMLAPDCDTDGADVKQSVTEQVYNMFRTEEERKARERRDRRWRNVRHNAIVFAEFLVWWAAGRIFLIADASATIRIFLYPDSVGDSATYLYGWLHTSHMFFIAAAVSIIPSLWGKFRYSLTTLGGYMIGYVLGELFGDNPSGYEIGHTDNGWAVWGVIFLFSIVMGIVIELIPKEKITLRSRQFQIWCAAAAVGVVVITLCTMGR